MANLASMYLHGRGVPADPVRAFQLCRQAAERGFAIAQNNLALMYANGEAVARDYVWAYVWLDLAAEHLTSSASPRDRIAAEMTAEEIAKAKQRAAQKRLEIQTRKP